jgi:hypothetical protein
MPPANLARILRQYGVALQTLDRSIGREDALPCDKTSLRECLILAMSIASDSETRRALSEGYVLVEAFVSERDYEAVHTFEERARAIHSRVANAMALRKRELTGGH